MHTILDKFAQHYHDNDNDTTVSPLTNLKLTRTLTKKSWCYSVAKHYSTLNSNTQILESELEPKHCLMLEFDPNVKRYLTQPFSCELTINGKRRRYTPDTLVELHDGSFGIVEVKPDEQYQKPKVREKLDEAKRYFEEAGVPFAVFTDKDIPPGKYIENLQQLYGLLNIKLDKRLTEKTMNALDKSQSLAIHEFVDIAKQNGGDVFTAWGMIARGYFAFDTTQLLTSESIITPHVA